jgi:hypothetical protein
MSTPSNEQQQQQDNAILASAVQEYVNHRNERFQQIVKIFLEDRQEFVVANLITESSPELKKSLAPDGLLALKDVARRDLFPRADGTHLAITPEGIKFVERSE